MPAPAAPFPQQPPPRDSSFPALYLYPLNDTWQPKHISLSSVHTKIGRQTSSKTAPGEKNGFFDSKVLSRQHAEVWEDGGKIFIKDVKSSNGTFINGERLSSEGTESEPFELKSDDIVEFGIDIVGEDNKTIIHHKVAARVVCVFSEQDAQIAARAEQHQQQLQLQQQQQQAIAAQQGALNQPGPSGINAGAQNFPFASAQRRAQLAQQGLGSLGPLGGLRQPGKTGLSFEVVLSRLQGELQKSRETGAELNSLTSAMNEIQDTLGGNAPTNPSHFPQRLPPVRPPQENPPPSTSPPPPPQPAVDAAAVLDIQSQLRDTQSSLATHLDKVRALEGALAEQEAIKQEVKTLRDLFQVRRRDSLEEPQHPYELTQEPRDGFDSEEEEHEVDDDDDARSIATLIPHELESVEEENEAELAEAARLDEAAAQEPHHDAPSDPPTTDSEEEARRREDLNVGRPRTPEPSRLGQHLPSALLSAPRRSSLSSPLSQLTNTGNTGQKSSEDVYEQVAKLTETVNTVLAVTVSLEAQHSAAQTTINALETKVQSLEAMLQAAQDALAKSRALEPAPPPAVSSESASLTDLMAEWKKTVEGQWSNVQEEWCQERERLNKAREEWESKFRQVDSGLDKVQTSINNVQQQQSQLQTQLAAVTSSQFHHHSLLNGDALKHTGGLVTPPSPRSQSSDSARYRRRRRRASRSQSRSRSRSRERIDTDMESEQEEHAAGGVVESGTSSGVAKGLASPASSRTPSERERRERPDHCLATPAPSLDASLGSLPCNETPSAGPTSNLSKGVDTDAVIEASESRTSDRPTINVQTALGVVILSVAAAAVLWKVKPE